MTNTVSFAGYDFPDNKACIACVHVLNGESVLVFSHESDGDLQFMCGRKRHTIDEARVVDVDDILQLHPDLVSLPVVEMGHLAERLDPNEEWVVL